MDNELLTAIGIRVMIYFTCLPFLVLMGRGSMEYFAAVQKATPQAKTRFFTKLWFPLNSNLFYGNAKVEKRLSKPSRWRGMFNRAFGSILPLIYIHAIAFTMDYHQGVSLDAIWLGWLLINFIFFWRLGHRLKTF